MSQYEVRKMDDEKFAVIMVGAEEPEETFDTEDEAKARCDEMNSGGKSADATDNGASMSSYSWDAGINNITAAVSKQLDKLGQRLERLIKPTSADSPVTSFKVFDNYWFGTWSNNFQDRDREFFSAKAIDAYIKRVDAGVTPLPELWVWHTKGSRIGVAEKVGTIEKDGGVTVWALGTFDDTPQASMAKSYYKTNPGHGMSHGFIVPPGGLKDRVYHKFNTFELSVLPLEYAANPYTSFEAMKEAQVDEKKRRHLEAALGKEAAETLVQQIEQKTAAQAEMLAFKDFLALADTSSDAATTAVNDAEENIKALTVEVVGDIADLTSGQLALLKHAKAQRDELAALKKEVADLKAFIDDTPRAASESNATATDDEDAKEALAAKEKDTVSDPIFGAFKTD